MSSPIIKGHTTSWETYEHDQQCGEYGSMDLGESERLTKEGNAIVNKVSAMCSASAKIIEKELIS